MIGEAPVIDQVTAVIEEASSDRHPSPSGSALGCATFRIRKTPLYWKLRLFRISPDVE